MDGLVLRWNVVFSDGPGSPIPEKDIKKDGNSWEGSMFLYYAVRLAFYCVINFKGFLGEFCHTMGYH